MIHPSCLTVSVFLVLTSRTARETCQATWLRYGIMQMTKLVNEMQCLCNNENFPRFTLNILYSVTNKGPKVKFFIAFDSYYVCTVFATF